MDISATFVRDCIRTGKSIKYLVPEPVGEHIIRKNSTSNGSKGAF